MLRGTVVSGLGRGAEFLALGWVASQLHQHLGLTPFPGTLNLRVEPAARAELWARRRQFLRIAHPASPDCPGYLTKVSLRANGRSVDSAWLILPEKTIYDDVIEIIAATSLRDALALSDGDPVEIEVI